MRSNFYLIKRVIQISRRYWPLVGLYFLLSILSTPLALLSPYPLKFLIDSGFGSEKPNSFFNLFLPETGITFSAILLCAAGFMIFLSLLSAVLTYVTWIVSIYTGEKIVLNFRTILFDHVQRLSLAYHDTKGASDSLYRIQWDTMCVRTVLLGHLPTLVTSLFTLVSMTIIMININWQFAVVALCTAIPLVFLSNASRGKLKKHYHEVKEAESNAMSVVHEVLGSLRVVKAFGQEKNENERFTDRSNSAVKSQLSLNKVSAKNSFWVTMVFAVGTTAVIYIGGKFVHSGQMTLGELTLVMAYLGMIYGPLQNLIKLFNEVQNSFASLDRVFAVLDEEREVKELTDAKPLTAVDGNFEFHNVSFCYNKDREVLNKVSFKIYSGDRVGIMGSTGAGKSTLINLLMRLYDPVTGEIKIDGVDIRKYKLTDYRKQFSIVLQDPVLFSTSIRENIRYGRSIASEKEIIDAAIAANAHNFIVNTTDGYDTMVGERGMTLSGGERQRISIARAFIKNAPILILDEPTSSLDIRTEGLIMEAMERLMEGRTTFMITHRLDTLSSCNVILHLEGGKLVECVRDHDADFISKKKAAILMP